MTTLSLTFAAPAPVVLRAAPTLSLAFPDPQPVVLQVQGIQGGGGGGGGGATNLAWNAATRTLSSDTGTDAVLTLADGSNAGLMSSASFLALSTALQPGALIPWTDIDGRPSLFPPSAHGHVAADISDFASAARGTALTGYSAAGSRIALVATDTILGAFGKLGKWVADLAAVAFSGSASDLTTGTLPAARFDDTAHGTRAGGTLHPAATTSVAGFMAAADKTKLDGVATGATANSADAFLLDRANHTGTQLAGTISNFAATVLATVLTGFSVAGSRTAVAATDTILAAFGKVQKWLNDLAAVAFSGSATDLTTGTLPNARLAAFGSGDVSFASGGGAGTIANNAVTLAKMADMATASLIYRKTAGTGDPEVNTLATLKTDLGLTGTNSGDQTSIVGITGTKAQFDTAVTDGNFMYIGDPPTAHNQTASTITDFAEAVDDRVSALIVAGTNMTITYNDVAGTLTFDAAGGGAGTDLAYTASTRLLASSTGADVTLPLVVAAGDAGLMSGADKTKLDGISGTNTGDQTITLTGNVTGSGTGSFAATIANDAVTNAKLANMATATIKGRTTAGTGDPEDLTGAQARGVLGLPAITVSTTAPGSPAVGDLWVDTN